MKQGQLRSRHCTEQYRLCELLPDQDDTLVRGQRSKDMAFIISQSQIASNKEAALLSVGLSSQGVESSQTTAIH